MEMDPSLSPLDQFTSLLQLPSTFSAAAATIHPSAAPVAVQLCCCCRGHLSLLPPAFAIIEGTPWAFDHQQDVYVSDKVSQQI
jgi:hypothetical protein